MGKGNFLTLRDDYQSVIDHFLNRDTERKYRLEKSMNHEEENCREYFKIQELKKNCPDLYVDYGYSLKHCLKATLMRIN